MDNPLFLGIDLGTSGCRGMVIDDRGQVLAEAYSDLPPPQRDEARVEQDPELWWQAMETVFKRLGQQVELHDIQSLAIDGTSGTLLVTDAAGNPLTTGLMYNDARAVEQSMHIDTVVPAQTAARGASSALAKLLWLQDHGLPINAAHALHQADWLANRLCGSFGLSDVNNCLKLGYDAQAQAWPSWMDELGVERHLLPRVLKPGEELGRVNEEMAIHFGLAPDTRVVAGTTDSTAAILASGATQPGEAVTSLGSTLVPKVICDKPIFDIAHGVYSQPFGRYWLVGGGSNSGGNVLLQYFSREELEAMVPQLQPAEPTGLDYYPLPSPGERFPVNDPELKPRLIPRPKDDVRFFQAMLEGMTRIERQAYDLLRDLGAPYPEKVYSLGGGAANPAWTQMRSETLGVQVLRSERDQAAYGTARLAAGLITP